MILCNSYVFSVCLAFHGFLCNYLFSSTCVEASFLILVIIDVAGKGREAWLGKRVGEVVGLLARNGRGRGEKDAWR